jgi:ABC-type dipeptide/oligopeptide/nickel transport system ATPase component
MGMILITHDLAVVAENAHTAAVLYAGRIVESAPVADLFEAPRHRTRRCCCARIRPAPIVHPDPARASRRSPVASRAGRRPSGCRFRDRCPIANRSAPRSIRR